MSQRWREVARGEKGRGFIGRRMRKWISCEWHSDDLPRGASLMSPSIGRSQVGCIGGLQILFLCYFGVWKGKYVDRSREK